MKVFHFMEKKHALSNLIHARLKVATLHSMNDSYEFYLNFYGVDESHLQAFKAHFNNTVGFLCFSTNLNDPVQWAHYAENHRGICFEFEIPNGILNEISYLDNPIHINPNDKEWRSNLVKATLCKYKGWAYEQEYRVTIDLNSKEVIDDSGLKFVCIEKAFIPTNVYLGLRCELTDDEIDIFNSNDISPIKMVQDLKSYAIKRA